jgi:hypothetical protein
MKAKVLILLTVTIALTVVTTSSAVARKPDNAGKPAPAPTAAPSCAERVNGGATAWHLGEYELIVPDAYSSIGLPACVDITRAEHLYVDPTAPEPQLGEMQWSISLTGEASRFKGVKLVFEQGVHGTVFAQTEIGPDAAFIDPDTGNYEFEDATVWTTIPFTPSGEPVSFVAMPRSGDKWITTPVVTVRPIHGG